MDLVTGAMRNLLPKLLQLLQNEYNLQAGVRAEVESLSRELESTHVALCKVAQVRHDLLDPQVQLWASEVREASYDMEDVLDTFLVHVDGGYQPANPDTNGKFERLREKAGKLLRWLGKAQARHGIAGAIEDIKKQVEEIAKRRDRYRIDDITVNPTATTSIDPRLSTLYTKASELVGIDEPRDALTKMLSSGDDDPSDKKMRIVSIVGSGGLGKTTLAKAVYDKITVNMNIYCTAFVPVGQNPDLRKVFRDILLGIEKEYYMNKINFVMALDERQLIDQIREFLKEKRRIFGSTNKCPKQLSELSEKILKKCRDLEGCRLEESGGHCELNIGNLIHLSGSEVAVEELGHLTQLRELHIDIQFHNFGDALISSLGNLQKLQSLYILHPRFLNVVTIPSMFPQGAMPRAENVTFCLDVNDFISSNCEFDFGDLAMGHLPSLRNIRYDLFYWGSSGDQGVLKVKEALRHAADVHPNHPSIKFYMEH
ncbi:hypothetical protein BAE44_0004309 [Dichanthelium oligosanthes]|uniref:Uncharacterized protein n=1 Tax=Dichanthelium oligosanthes TaxID=888268 RepID=A0A1E5WBB4_9POAL|nr:hypothetical protein BAE44_0004309 [Dichanthelium oligosanthes]